MNLGEIFLIKRKFLFSKMSALPWDEKECSRPKPKKKYAFVTVGPVSCFVDHFASCLRNELFGSVRVFTSASMELPNSLVSNRYYPTETDYGHYDCWILVFPHKTREEQKLVYEACAENRTIVWITLPMVSQCTISEFVKKYLPAKQATETQLNQMANVYHNAGQMDALCILWDQYLYWIESDPSQYSIELHAEKYHNELFHPWESLDVLLASKRKAMISPPLPTDKTDWDTYITFVLSEPLFSRHTHTHTHTYIYIYIYIY